MIRALAGGMPLIGCAIVWVAVVSSVGSWRRGLLYAVPVCGLLIMASTELLSVAHQLKPVSIAILWSLVSLAGVAWTLHQRSGLAAPAWSRIGPIASGWLTVELVVLGAVALASPPNTWDAMTYHMARVANWSAQGSVDTYATEISRQLFSAPFAEYAITHTVLLSGEDVWANTVQLVATAVTVVAISVLAANLGLPRYLQVWAAVIAATLPMAVAQAPTTHNDAVLTMLVVCCAALVTDPSPRLERWPHVAAVAATVALAIATKGTAFFFLPPLGVWYAVRLWQRRPVVLARAAVISVFAVGAVNAGVWGRNLAAFGNPLSPSDGHIRPELTPETLVLTTVRDLGLQLGLPLGERVNAWTADLLTGFVNALGLDVNDPGSMPDNYEFFVQFGTREDSAGNLAHTVLLLVAVIALLARRRLTTRLALLLGCTAAGFVLLALLARWSPFGNRYLLTCFVLVSPVTAAGLAALPRAVGRLALVGLCVSASFWMFASDLRPVFGPRSVFTVPRNDQYFAARPELRGPYLDAVRFVRSRDPSVVGLVQSPDSWEYPLWVLLNDSGDRVRLRSLAVTNDSKRYAEPTHSMVICTVECPPRLGTGAEQRHFGTVTVLVSRAQ